MSDRTIKKHEIYRHYKGGIYTILELPVNTANGEVMVVYAGIRGVWVRSLADFEAVLCDQKEDTRFYRFELVSEASEN